MSQNTVNQIDYMYLLTFFIASILRLGNIICLGITFMENMIQITHNSKLDTCPRYLGA